MHSSCLTIFLLALFSPASSDAQEISGTARSLEEQQAISHIGRAEYYARMALRSLEASEKIGKAPYFNYQNAKEDIEKVLNEFKTYLKGDESTDFPPAVPLVVDGRYFAESIKDFLATKKTDEGQGNLQGNSNEARSPAPKAVSENVETRKKKNVSFKEQRSLRQNSTIIFSPPEIVPENIKTKKEKIEEILKKGL